MSNSQKSAFSATKILLPVNFDAFSEASLEAATSLAKQFHTSIHLVHIIPETPNFNGSDFFPETQVLEERREVIEQKLDAWKQRLEAQGVETTFSIETGNDIVGHLMLVIKRENVDMIVISTHGLSGWRPLILGSIAEQMIKLVDCTLVLLRSSHKTAVTEETAMKSWEDTFVPEGIKPMHLEPSIPTLETAASTRLGRS
jgi:nucleotide-binding universal stress UspA family protein